MKKNIEIAIKIIVSLLFILSCSGIMVYCFIAGAPTDKDSIIRYVISAISFSVLVSMSLCILWWYVRYLRKKIEKLEKREDEMGEKH